MSKKSELQVELALWGEDFSRLVSKMIEFQQEALSTTTFFFDKALWKRSFESSIDPESPLLPTNLISMVFYALEYLGSKDLSNGIRDTTPADMIAELEHILALVYSKNKDYGSSALESPILLPWLDVRCGLLVRLSDKITRMRTLFKQETSEVNESFEDTLRDIVGYIFLLYAVLRTEETLNKEEARESREV